MSGPSAYWWRNFHRRHPLTQRFARTLAEADADPYDFIEGPIAGDRGRGWITESMRWSLSLVLLCLMVTAPKWWPLFFGG